MVISQGVQYLGQLWYKVTARLEAPNMNLNWIKMYKNDHFIA